MSLTGLAVDAAASHPSIVVVGSLNMDLVVRTSRMPAPGETVMGKDFFVTPGGKGANQAVAAARLGGRVRMVGCVGSDDFGIAMVEGLGREGIDTEHVRTIHGMPSGVAVIHVDDEGENAITVAAGANASLTGAHLDSLRAVIQGADAVLLQLEVPVETTIKAIGIAQKASVPTILDVAPVPESGIPASLYRVEVLTPNQHEASLLTDIEVIDVAGAEKAAIELRRRGARNVVIKLGGQGALFAGEDSPPVHIPAFHVDSVDTTAAGDAFTAALALGWAEGQSPEAAVRLGCAAGALAVTMPGAQNAMPYRTEVAGLCNL